MLEGNKPKKEDNGSEGGAIPLNVLIFYIYKNFDDLVDIPNTGNNLTA